MGKAVLSEAFSDFLSILRLFSASPGSNVLLGDVMVSHTDKAAKRPPDVERKWKPRHHSATTVHEKQSFNLSPQRKKVREVNIGSGLAKLLN